MYQQQQHYHHLLRVQQMKRSLTGMTVKEHISESHLYHVGFKASGPTHQLIKDANPPISITYLSIKVQADP